MLHQRDRIIYRLLEWLGFIRKHKVGFYNLIDAQQIQNGNIYKLAICNVKKTSITSREEQK